MEDRDAETNYGNRSLFFNRAIILYAVLDHRLGIQHSVLTAQARETVAIPCKPISAGGCGMHMINSWSALRRMRCLDIFRIPNDHMLFLRRSRVSWARCEGRRDCAPYTLN